MTSENLEYFRDLIRSAGPKGTLVLKLANETELTVRGNWSIHAQMDLFRDRVLLSSPWTEIWVSLKDVDTARVEGKRIVVRMKTGAVAWVPMSA